MRRFLAISLLLGLLTTIAASWLLALRTYVHDDPQTSFVTIPVTASPDRIVRARFDGCLGRGFEMYLMLASHPYNIHSVNRVEIEFWRNNPLYSPTITPRINAWAAPLMFPWLHNRPWPDGVRTLHAIVAHGWPFPAMWSRYASSLRSVGDLGVHDHAIAIPNREIAFTSGYRLPSALPLGIAWPGFTANTAIYAAAWLSLLLTARTLRAASRRRRNLCPHCSYPLSSLPPNSPCPECGAQRSNLKAESSNDRTPI